MQGTNVCEDVLWQEADFEQTIALLELSAQEIEVRFQNSLEEVLYPDQLFSLLRVRIVR